MPETLQLVGETRAPEEALKDPRIGRPPSLAWLRSVGFTAFSIAPLRADCGMGDELMRRFSADPAPGRPAPFFSGRLELEQPAVLRCGEHGRFLEVLDTRVYPWFRSWMLAQNVVDRFRRKLWICRSYPTNLLDPFALPRRAGGRRIRESLDIWCPSGTSARAEPAHALQQGVFPEQVDLARRPPDPQVIGLAGAFFGLVRA